MDGERLVVVQARPVELPLFAFQSAQATEDDPLLAAVARIARDRQRGEEIASRGLDTTSCLVEHGDVGQRLALLDPLSGVAMDRERSLGLLASDPKRPCSMFRLPRLPSTSPSWRRSPSSRLIESALSKWARASSNRPCSAWTMARLFSTGP